MLGACHPGDPRGGPGDEWARHPSAALSPAAARWISGGNAFAIDLYHRRREATGDLFLSPRSVRRALAMLSAGAAGATADEMAAALRFAPLTGAAVHAAQAEADAYLASGTGRGAQLLLAAAVWSRADAPLRAAFVQTSREAYGAEVTPLDFSRPEAARRRIAAWISGRTRGLIDAGLPPGSVDPATSLLLTDAVHFHGTWQRRFARDDTTEGEFHTPDGPVRVPMMHIESDFRYSQSRGVELLQLPYSGGRLAMTILLPTSHDLSALEAALTPEQLRAWQADTYTSKVDVTLPRFTAEASTDLAAALTALGMPAAFTAAADFTGIDGTPGHALTQVVQLARCEVDEEGTRAAAVTIARLGKAGHPSFTADHPFIFIIEDTGSGEILFIGRLTDPR